MENTPLNNNEFKKEEFNEQKNLNNNTDLKKEDKAEPNKKNSKEYLKDKTLWIAAAIGSALMLLGVIMGSSIVLIADAINKDPDTSEVKPISPLDPISENKEVYTSKVAFKSDDDFEDVLDLDFRYYTETGYVWVQSSPYNQSTGYSTSSKGDYYLTFYNEGRQVMYRFDERDMLEGTYYPADEAFKFISGIDYITQERQASQTVIEMGENIDFEFTEGKAPTWTADPIDEFWFSQENDYINLN